MRPLRSLLPLLAIAQAAGILFADRVWIRSEIALPLAALALLLALLVQRPALLTAASAMVVAFCAGAVALEARLQAAIFVPPGGVVEASIEGRVARVALQGDWMWIELRRVRNLDSAGPSLPRGVRIQGPRTPPPSPALESHRVGERIRTRVRLKPPRVLQNPGSRDRSRSFARRGIGAIGHLVHPALHVEVEASNTAPLSGILEPARTDASQRLRAAGVGGGLLAALSLGDRSGLCLEARDALARLGLSHLIAVSGLHLTLIAALGYAVSRLAFRRLGLVAERGDPRRLSILVAIAVAGAYALLSGWGIPVRRALVFLAAVAIGFLRRRPGRRGHPLALAAIVVLAFEPGALFEAGGQMSFAASAAILAGLGARKRAEEGPGIGLRIRRDIDALLRTSATAIAATAPLAAVHFGQVAPVGVLANLIAVPLTAVLLLPASLLAALATLVRPEVPLTELTVSASAAVASAALRGAEQIASWLPDPSPIPAPSITSLLLAFTLGALVTRLRATSARIVLTAVEAGLLATAPHQRLIRDLRAWSRSTSDKAPPSRSREKRPPSSSTLERRFPGAWIWAGTRWYRLSPPSESRDWTW